MLDGMYSAAAGMAAQQARIDAAANDLANTSTTGYKPVRVAFRDLVYDRDRAGTSNGVALGTGAAATDVGRSTQQGPVQETGEPLDVAVQGAGGIAVRRPDGGGTALTRDGHLRLNERSELVTASGARLDPPVQLPQGTQASDVTIAADGTVTAGGRRAGQVRLVDVPAPAGLQTADGNLLVPTQASGAVRAARGSTLQVGALEGSGTDTASAMTDLMSAQRAYQLTSRAIQIADQAAEIANGIKR